MTYFDWRRAEALGETIVRSINNLAGAVRSTKPDPGRELDPDPRAGAAIRHLANHGVDVIELKRSGVGWMVRAKTKDDKYSVVTADHTTIVRSLEYAARDWPR